MARYTEEQVRAACEQLAAEGLRVTKTAVVERSGVSWGTLKRRQDLRATIAEYRESRRPVEGLPGLVRAACEALLADGVPVTHRAVEERSGVGHSTIWRHQELRELIAYYRARQPVPERSGPVLPPPLGPLDVLAREWIDGRAARGDLLGKSQRVERTRLSRLLELHADRPVVGLDRRTLQTWQESIGGLRPETRRAYRYAVKAFCRWLVDEGHLVADPSDRLSKPRIPRKESRSIKPAEVNCLLAACPSRLWQTVVLLMEGAGLRAVEVSNLDLEDWDSVEDELLVTGKGGHERRVPLADYVKEALLTYLVERGGKSGPMFLAVGSRPSPDGRLSAHWISEKVAQIFAQAGVKRQPGDGRTGHALRHTFAAEALAATNDLLAVKELMGHANISTTNRYLGVAGKKRLRAAVEERRKERRSGPTRGEATVIAFPTPAAPSETPVRSEVAEVAAMDRAVTVQESMISSTRIHCPACCANPAGPCTNQNRTEDCAGWIAVPVSAIRLWPADAGHWWYDAGCSECGARVDGPIGATKASDYLRRGALRAL